MDVTKLLDLLTEYSPLVVLFIVFGIGLSFVIKLIVERSITSKFEEKSKVFEAQLKNQFAIFETHLKRRSAFEEKVLSDRFALITGFSTRLEHVMTNLNRLRCGESVPDGFMKQNEVLEIVPLTAIFEDIEIHRLVLGEDFHRLFSNQAQWALKAANISTEEEWRESGKKWARLREEIRLATEAAFGISKIHW